MNIKRNKIKKYEKKNFNLVFIRLAFYNKFLNKFVSDNETKIIELHNNFIMNYNPIEIYFKIYFDTNHFNPKYEFSHSDYNSKFRFIIEYNSYPGLIGYYSINDKNEIKILTERPEKTTNDRIYYSCVLAKQQLNKKIDDPYIPDDKLSQIVIKNKKKHMKITVLVWWKVLNSVKILKMQIY